MSLLSSYQIVLLGGLLFIFLLHSPLDYAEKVISRIHAQQRPITVNQYGQEDQE